MGKLIFTVLIFTPKSAMTNLENENVIRNEKTEEHWKSNNSNWVSLPNGEPSAEKLLRRK